MANTKKVKPKKSTRKVRDLPVSKKITGNVKGGRSNLWIE